MQSGGVDPAYMRYIHGDVDHAGFTMSSSCRIAQHRLCPWESVQNPPELLPDELHLWWVPLSAPAPVTNELAALLSSSERARADRFHFERHRQAYILGRSTLRLLLANYTGTAGREITFTLGPYGKPALATDTVAETLGFNYSDAGAHALYGFTWNADIGVDLENLDREVGFDRIVQRRFTPAEADSILGLPEARQRTAFLACWTRKEGYGKAEGWGIRYPLDSEELCVDCETDRLDLQTGNGKAKNWVIQQIYPTERFVGCVVYPTALESRANFAIRYFTTNPGLR
jgi:4'-phosphopantetheinyl transferase